MEDDAIIGTDGDDDLRGTSRDDVIRGLGGDDALRGRGGDDRLEGGRGDDTLRGGSGDDLLQGGEGDDTLLGGGGLDIADYSDLRAEDGVSLDMRDPDGAGFVGADIDRDGEAEERDRVQVAQTNGVGIEGFRGGAGADRFIGNAEDNVVIGSAGADVHVGGGGFDMIDFTGTDFAVALSLAPDGSSSGEFIVQKDLLGGSTSFSGFERIVADPARFAVIGTFEDDPEPFGVPLDVDLGAGRATFLGAAPNGGDLTIEVIGFSGVTGSAGDDVIVGGGGNGQVDGTLGDDVIRGDIDEYLLYYESSAVGGASLIAGLDGTYTLLGEDGRVVGRDTVGSIDVEAGTVEVFETVFAPFETRSANTIDGSTGLPEGATVFVDLELETRNGIPFNPFVVVQFEEDVGGFEAGDFFSFEIGFFDNAIGSARGDTLLGNEEDNRLSGRGGDDFLRGRAGDDELRGGRGADQLLGEVGDDLLIGGGGGDIVTGQAGDDVIDGGRGADVLGGGAGADTFRFSGSTIAADAGEAVDFVSDFTLEDELLLAGRTVSAGAAFDLAVEEATLGGVQFGLNNAGTRIMLRADGEDEGAAIAAEEVFARLRIEPDDFALG